MSGILTIQAHAVQCGASATFGRPFQHRFELFLRDGHHLAALHWGCIHDFVLQKWNAHLVGGLVGLAKRCQIAMPALQPVLL